MVEVEEDALVEVEEVVPQTAEEMRVSGLAAELAAMNIKTVLTLTE